MTLAISHATEDPCTLCGSHDTRLVFNQRVGGSTPLERSFVQCRTCELVFVPRRFHLSPAHERAVYDQHQNSPRDLRYRAFLSRLVMPLREVLQTGDSGLDFGCGPGPTLSVMMRESGVECADYDPFYHDDQSLLTRHYDFIASSEVFEHLAAPGHVLQQLSTLLKPDGWMGVMTKRLASLEALPQWHYIRDPTHVCFFTDATFAWMGQQFSFDVRFVSADVVLMQAHYR